LRVDGFGIRDSMGKSLANSLEIGWTEHEWLCDVSISCGVPNLREEPERSAGEVNGFVTELVTTE
jgi:hypothetical protein